MPDSGPLDGDGRHRFPIRVYWEDTDGSGIVYHANYLRFAERARTEMLRSVGIEQGRLLDQDGVGIAVRRCRIDFQAPARLDDFLVVASRVTGVSGASLDLEQAIWRGESVLVAMTLQLACLNRVGRATRLPKAVRAAVMPIFAPRTPLPSVSETPSSDPS